MIDTWDKEQQSAAIQDVKSIDDEDKDKDIRRKHRKSAKMPWGHNIKLSF